MTEQIIIYLINEDKNIRECIETSTNLTFKELVDLFSDVCKITDFSNGKITLNKHKVNDETLTLDEMGITNHSVLKYSSQKDSEDIPTKYPLFIRNTRIKSSINTKPIRILEPESIPQKPELNIVLTLMPTLIMFALVVVLRGFMNSSQGSFVLFSICSMGLGVITSVANIFATKKKYKKECSKRKEKYLKYIEEKKQEIEYERKEEKECLEETYYSITDDVCHIREFSPYLFDRTPTDDDFLDLYLGTGKVEALKKIDYKEQDKLESHDEISIIPSQISYDYKYIDEAPVRIKLSTANAVGVVSDKKYQYNFLKNMIIDIASRQYYGDVNIYLCVSEEDMPKYKWVEMLPHIQQRESGIRNIVYKEEDKNIIFEGLYNELNYRSDNKGVAGYNIVILLEEYGIKSHPVSKYIEHASKLNTVFIFFEDNSDKLPLYCSSIIRLVNDTAGVIFDSNNKMENQRFNYATVSDDEIMELMETLAPIYCEEISLDSDLRKSITLFELLGIKNVNEIHLKDKWEKSKIYETMAVPLGINVKDEIVYLNLHEKFHGPHGLVAGTTGSGKSEILQSFILSASILFNPHEIGFLIIDFKGGGMVNQFSDLPHLMGAITNIDGKQINRSLKSIKAELLKRQNLFAQAGVNHIDKYIMEYKKGNVREALPHLVIIVDEFAELKAEQPEFMKELISAARIGRSLGIHLILATQKPAGQVNEQIWSNSKFKLCLKVQNKEDSNEVIKSPLAAEIREPGRAYLQVGNNEIFELFQSAYSGATAKTGNEERELFVASVDSLGRKEKIIEQKRSKEEVEENQLEAIVKYVSDYCQEEKISKLREICLPALEKIIKYQKIQEKNAEINIPIGIFDDPDNQRQEKAYISVGTSNTLIIGSSQFGKTNLLQTVIRRIAENYTPEEVSMYILDFGSMFLKNFETLPNVGGVICPAEDEKIKKFFKFLYKEILSRKEKLLEVGVSSFNSYKEAGYKDLPNIVVIIDNMTVLKELYLQEKDELIGLCRDGVSTGITFILANAQTTGFGFKYLTNFSTRIALFCNEKSEYLNLFGTNKVSPDEIPGRCILEIDKAIYECQTYLAFEGDKEFERVNAIKEFITERNENVVGRAKRIPEIPSVLTQEKLYNMHKAEKCKVVIGLDYESVSGYEIDMRKKNMLTIVGETGSGKSNFIKYLINYQSLYNRGINNYLYIIDDFRKKLENQVDEHAKYSIQFEKISEYINEIVLRASEKMTKMVNGEEVEEDFTLLILNNEQVIEYISKDKIILQQFRDLIGKYKMLNIFVVVSNVPNEKIASYGAPELYKIIKENKNILYLGNLEECNICDVNVQTLRKYNKKIQKGDAYFFSQGDLVKVKTPLV